MSFVIKQTVSLFQNDKINEHLMRQKGGYTPTGSLDTEVQWTVINFLTLYLYNELEDVYF